MKNNVFRWALIVIALGVFAKYAPCEAKAKAKLKVIDYGWYKIEGYVYKKNFVDGTIITAFKNETDTFFTGVYSCQWYGDKVYDEVISGYINCSPGVRFEGSFTPLNLSVKKSVGRSFRAIPLQVKSVSITGTWGKFSAKEIPGTNNINFIIDLSEDTLVSRISGTGRFRFYQPTPRFGAYDAYVYSKWTYWTDRTVSWNEWFIRTDTVSILMRNGDRFDGCLSSYYNLLGIGCDGELGLSVFDITGNCGNIECSSGEYAFASGEKLLSDYDYSRSIKLSSFPKILNEKKKRKAAREAARQEQLRKEREAAERARQEKLARKQKAEERRKRLIAKYGTHYGTLLADKKLELGMTKAMVNEVYRKNLYSVSQYKGGVEVWTMGNYAGLMGGGFLGELMALGQLSMPRMLVFKNGKLIEIHRN